MNSISVSHARQQLPKLVEEVDSRFERLFITKNGKTKAVLMAFEEFESWIETLDSYEDEETMKIHKELDKMSISQIKNSKKFISLDQMKKHLGID